MRLTGFVGLQALEKGNLAIDLARSLYERGAQVLVIDHISGKSLSSIDVPGIEIISVEQWNQIPPMLESTSADHIILATSETMPPEMLFTQLLNLQIEYPNIEMTSIALIDDRTCDCFPHVQALLEENADVVLRNPFTLNQLLEGIQE